MLHVIAFVTSRISSESVDSFELVLRWSGRHRVLNLISTLLDPLFIENRGMRVLVIAFSLYELGQGELELGHVLEHHLFEAKMASVQEDWNQTGVKFDRSLVMHTDFKLSQALQNIFDCFIK